MVVIAVTCMIMPPMKEHCAYGIHGKANDRDNQCFRVEYLDGVQRSLETLPGHPESKKSECYGSTISAERIHLTRAESKSWIVGMTSSIRVGKQCDAKRERVRPHVKSVCQQRHRTRVEAEGDLTSHHQQD